jgi:hypothetical protein
MRGSTLCRLVAAIVLLVAVAVAPAVAAQGQEMKDAHGMTNRTAPAYGNDHAAAQSPISLLETDAVDIVPVTTTLATTPETQATTIPVPTIAEAAAGTTSVAGQSRSIGPSETGMQGGNDDRTGLFVLAFIAVAAIAAALYGYFRLSKREAAVDPDHTVVAGGAVSLADAGGFPPALAGRYTGVAPVGSGGTARVFLATRVSDGRTVAVKVPLRTDEATGRTFLKEISIWKGLVHQNIVRVCAVNILPSPYVEMEYFERSLKDLEKPLSPSEACDIVAGVAEGLAYAHARGVIHRDLKPGNILLAPDGTPKIADWGLGRVLADDDETVAPGFSLRYAAPEQLAPARYGSAGAWTDLFQLGVVLYELLTGAFPYAATGPGEYAGAVLRDDPVPPSAVEQALAGFDPIVLRCLEKDPGKRYASAEAFLADLRAIEC